MNEMFIFEMGSNPVEATYIFQVSIRNNYLNFPALKCENHLSVPYIKPHFKCINEIHSTTTCIISTTNVTSAAYGNSITTSAATSPASAIAHRVTLLCTLS